MARQNSALEYNTFVQGLITEASPLNMPDNSSSDERNFVLERDGSRRRRLGLDFEEGNLGNFYGTGTVPNYDYPISSFTWDNAGGTSKSLVVVQVGISLSVYNNDGSNLYGSIIGNFQVSPNNQVVQGTRPGLKATYATVSGFLVVASGDDDIAVVDYDGTGITVTRHRLKIRDTFGLPAISTRGSVGGPFEDIDLRVGNGVGHRPYVGFTSPEDLNNHIYNLRNQGWSSFRREYDSENISDPLQQFIDAAVVDLGVPIGSLYPANSDRVVDHLYPDPEASGDRIGDRFFSTSAVANPSGTFDAPRGHFIIDLLKRGESRNEVIEDYQSDNPDVPVDLLVSSLPEDTSVGGISCTESYAGRAWYAGFDGELDTEQSDFSPILSPYVAFTKLIKSKSDLGACYQEGDPTSKEFSDLVDTDGGIISIDGADNIVALKAFGDSLLVFASNGVWRISGGSDYGFTATNYQVSKVGFAGLVSSGTIIETPTAVLYWSKDGIYAIGMDQSGLSMNAQNLSKSTIQSFYNAIPQLDKEFSDGMFDRFDRKARWLFGTRPSSEGVAKELVLDVDLGAFYVNEMSNETVDHPVTAAYVRVPPYDVGTVSNSGIDDIRELKYVVYLNAEVGLAKQISFALMRDKSFVDWSSNFRADPVEFESYLITGLLTGPEFQRNKQVPYLTMHFLRTEDGFEEIGGAIQPTNQSGCIVQARFDWSSGPKASGWGRKFRAYRYRRHYIPSDVNDPYDTGEEVLSTKNKIRGKGKSVHFLIKSEPGKDCRLLGWSMIVGVNGNV